MLYIVCAPPRDAIMINVRASSAPGLHTKAAAATTEARANSAFSIFDTARSSACMYIRVSVFCWKIEIGRFFIYGEAVFTWRTAVCIISRVHTLKLQWSLMIFRVVKLFLLRRVNWFMVIYTRKYSIKYAALYNYIIVYRRESLTTEFIRWWKYNGAVKALYSVKSSHFTASLYSPRGSLLLRRIWKKNFSNLPRRPKKNIIYVINPHQYT